MEEFLDEYEVFSDEELLEKARGLMQELRDRREGSGELNTIDIDHILSQMNEIKELI